MKKIHNKGEAVLFQNSHIEFLTKANPIFLWISYPLVIPSIISYGMFLHPELKSVSSLLLFGAAFFSWTLFEYMVHRFLFHYKPRHKWSKKLVYLFHENHHEYPRDKNRLLMPPLPAAVLAVGIFYLLQLVMDKLTYVFFPGFVSGYLVYAMIHYSIHAFNPPYRWLKPLWKQHQLHHYKDAAKGFGVSTSLWDRLFRSAYQQNEIIPPSAIEDISFPRTARSQVKMSAVQHNEITAIKEPMTSAEDFNRN